MFGMKQIRKFFRRIGGFLKDLFYGTDNLGADLARILAFAAVVGELYAAYHNMKLGKEVDLGPSGLGGGMAAILTAAAAYLAAKAWSKKKSRESAAIAQNVAVAAKNDEPVAPVPKP